MDNGKFLSSDNNILPQAVAELHLHPRFRSTEIENPDKYYSSK